MGLKLLRCRCKSGGGVQDKSYENINGENIWGGMKIETAVAMARY